MYTIDNLFGLPAPLALRKTLIRPQGSLLFPILSSVLIHTLFLVNVRAPNALTVARSELISRDIEVPIFNLTLQAQLANGWFNVDGDDLTPKGEEEINSVLLNLQELTWAVPQDCGLKCSFNFIYLSPGLECHDVIPGGSQEPPNSLYSEYYVYQANSTLYLQNVTTSSSQKTVDDAPFDLSINYTAVTNASVTNPTFSSRAGTYCRFYNATYNASFELHTSSSTQRASTSVIHHGHYLSLGDTAAPTTSFNELQEKFASWAICYAFALAFRGGPFSIADIDGISETIPVVASIFNISINASIYSFDLAVSNLSETLVDMFSNLTLRLISTRGGQDMITANARMWDGSNVWIYTPRRLWATYLPAVTLAITVALYGIYTIHASGIAMDDKFSSFLLATQNAKLYEMCGEAADFEELQRLQLIHQNKGTFVVVDPGLKSPN
jgi:hypothetical protein